MKKWILIFSLLSAPTFAQFGMSGSPMNEAPLTVIFRDVTRYDTVRSVVGALLQSQMVKPLVLRRAQRGYLEYEGYSFGQPEALMGFLRSAVGSGADIRSRRSGRGGLEILVTHPAL